MAGSVRRGDAGSVRRGLALVTWAMLASLRAQNYGGDGTLTARTTWKFGALATPSAMDPNTGLLVVHGHAVGSRRFVKDDGHE